MTIPERHSEPDPGVEAGRVSPPGLRFLPLGIDVRDQVCTVVGGVAVATRKVRTLLQAGARVTIVAPEVSEELAGEIEAGRVRWVQGLFSPEHIDAPRLVVMATSDSRVNEEGVRLAASRRVLACDASSAERSQAIFGALLREDGVTIATFTDGRDPALARRTRDAIAELLPGGKRRDQEAPLARDAVMILVAHGSRNPTWIREVEELASAIGEVVGAQRIRLAYSQLSSPTLSEAVAEARSSGARRLSVLPLFMTGSGHVERDVAPEVERLRRAHPDVDLELMLPVGQHPSFREMLIETIRRVTA